MNSILKKITLITFTFLYIIFTNNISSFADTLAEPVVNAPSCILINLNTGKTLYSKNANEQYYPASTTKLMTAILTLENCKLTDTAKVSHDAVFNVPFGYTNAALVEGEELSIKDLLYVLMLPSANDAAFVLAEHIAGSVEQFSNMMNEKALELGCKHTHFVNPNGIHNENHYSTAYDLALIGQYAMKNDTLRQIVSTTNYQLPITNKYDKEDRFFSTTNELIKSSSKYYYQYATGCKTGYTDAAKNCIIATAQKDNVELLAVVLCDGKSEDGTSLREVDCTTLFNYGFDNFSFKKMIDSSDILSTIKIRGATIKTKKLDLNLETDLYAFVHNDITSSDATTTIVLKDNLQAPIAQNEIVGTINYTIDGTTYTSNLVASHDVYKINILKIVSIILLVLAVLILFKLIFKSSHHKRKTHKKLSSSNKNKRMSHMDYYNLHRN